MVTLNSFIPLTRFVSDPVMLSMEIQQGTQTATIADFLELSFWCDKSVINNCKNYLIINFGKYNEGNLYCVITPHHRDLTLSIEACNKKTDLL